MTQTFDAAAVEASVRDVTDEEIAFYEANGWVKLDGLISPLLAAELRRLDGPGAQSQTFWDAAQGFARDRREPFRSLVFSETMARNAQRLMNRRRLGADDVPVRYLYDLVVRKGVEKTVHPYHQDRGEFGFDRTGDMAFWVALDEVTPEMGPMRFLSGVHREGPLGLWDVHNGPDLLQLFPNLVDLYELSPPLHYQPGDATVHHQYMIHGSAPNTTDRPRWSYIFSYAPADALSRGDGLKPLDDERYPVLNPAAG